MMQFTSRPKTRMEDMMTKDVEEAITIIDALRTGDHQVHH